MLCMCPSGRAHAAMLVGAAQDPKLFTCCAQKKNSCLVTQKNRRKLERIAREISSLVC